MDRRIEKQLHDVFDPLAPDIISGLKTKDYPKIKSERELFSEYRRPYPFLKSGSLAAIFLVACILSAFLYFTTFVPAGTVTIKADQNYRLSINRKNRIISVKVDGKENRGGQVSVPDLKGKDLDKGLDLIFDSAHKSVPDKKAQVEISYSCKGKVDKTEKIITDCVDRYAGDMDIIMNGKAQSAENVEEAESTEDGFIDLTVDSDAATEEDPAMDSTGDSGEDPDADPSQTTEAATAAATSQSTETTAASTESSGKKPSDVLSGNLTETTSGEDSDELEETVSSDGSAELTENNSPNHTDQFTDENRTDPPAVPEGTTETYSSEELTQTTVEDASGSLLQVSSRTPAEVETQEPEMP